MAEHNLKEKILGNRWGAQTLICLFISVISGVILSLQYNAVEPLYSTATIEVVVPFGSFWRALHYYSSQASFLLLLCHLTVIIWQNEYSFTRRAWVRLMSSLPVAILLLFTGYILRGDATGYAAGAIAEHIALSIPLVGHALNNLLFDVMENGVQKVYANHLIGLMVLGGICVWPHLRRYTAQFRHHTLLVLTIFALSIAFSPPIEPDKFGLLYIEGPWFFLGLQEFLHYIPAFWAGVIFPSSLIVALYLLPQKEQQRTWPLLFIIAWLLVYAMLSGFSISRM